jgi:hypothetical protein
MTRESQGLILLMGKSEQWTRFYCLLPQSSVAALSDCAWTLLIYGTVEAGRGGMHFERST